MFSSSFPSFFILEMKKDGHHLADKEKQE